MQYLGAKTTHFSADSFSIFVYLHLVTNAE